MECPHGAVKTGEFPLEFFCEGEDGRAIRALKFIPRTIKLIPVLCITHIVGYSTQTAKYK